MTNLLEDLCLCMQAYRHITLMLQCFTTRLSIKVEHIRITTKTDLCPPLTIMVQNFNLPYSFPLTPRTSTKTCQLTLSHSLKASTFHSIRIRSVPHGPNCGQRWVWGGSYNLSLTFCTHLSIHRHFDSPLPACMAAYKATWFQSSSLDNTGWNNNLQNGSGYGQSAASKQWAAKVIYGMLTFPEGDSRDREKEWSGPLWGLLIKGWAMRPRRSHNIPLLFG